MIKLQITLYNCHFSEAKGPYFEAQYLLFLRFFFRMKEPFAGDCSFLALTTVNFHVALNSLIYRFGRKLIKENVITELVT